MGERGAEESRGNSRIERMGQMADREQRPNSGVLFKNIEKAEGGHDNWPDYKGSIQVAGVDYWLSAWIKKGKKGKFMTLAVKAKEGQGQPAQQQDRSDNDPF